jgi:hypothetical protein
MYERVPMLTRKNREIPSDMVGTLHTLLYASCRSGVEELEIIGKAIEKLYGKKFASQVEKDTKYVHEIIRDNINFITPEEGWKVKRLMEIAREVNQPYTPSERMLLAYKKYIQTNGDLYNNNENSSKISNVTVIPPQPMMPRPVQPGLYSKC